MPLELALSRRPDPEDHDVAHAAPVGPRGLHPFDNFSDVDVAVGAAARAVGRLFRGVWRLLIGHATEKGKPITVLNVTNFLASGAELGSLFRA